MIDFTVRSDPQPKGSKKAFVNPKNGRAIIVDDNKKPLRNWEQIIRDRANDALTDGKMLVGALEVTLEFRVRRPGWATPGPKSKRVPPSYPVTKPDVDKLARAVLDALRSVLYEDDAQVATLVAMKAYTVGDEPPGVRVRIAPLDQTETETPLPWKPVF